VLHLIGLDENDPAAVSGSGAVHHVAFMGTGGAGFIDRISAAGIEHIVRDVPGIDQRQVFIKDPNGITVEISFQGEIAASGSERLGALQVGTAG
jgi:catechol 2,3-dioxygenase-like lactoylglutathione lyase family enzyme